MRKIATSFILCVILVAGCLKDRDQSVAFVRAVDERVAALKRSGEGRLAFTYLPKSTLGDGTAPIGDYTLTVHGTGDRREVRISEQGGQTHATYQFPDVVPGSLTRFRVSKRAGEPLTVTLTRVGDKIELSEMR
jgi:hypothetical protein